MAAVIRYAITPHRAAAVRDKVKRLPVRSRPMRNEHLRSKNDTATPTFSQLHTKKKLIDCESFLQPTGELARA